MTIRPALIGSAAVALTFAAAGIASAGVCDLSTDGASCGPSLFTNFAIFQELSPQPRGTGYVDPFLRLQANGHEEGYNTSARPFQGGMDQKDPVNYTHDVLLSAGPVTTIGGVEYREFFLDINESANHPYLSLDELRIYLSPTGNLDSYNASNNTLNGLTAIYDLDAGGDNYIKLNYSLNAGSGAGDMVAYIPNSLFTGPSTQYLYLFSRFGDTYRKEAEAGFEEWWVGPTGGTPQQPAAVPEPATLLLVGTGLAVAARRRRTHAR